MINRRITSRANSDSFGYDIFEDIKSGSYLTFWKVLFYLCCCSNIRVCCRDREREREKEKPHQLFPEILDIPHDARDCGILTWRPLFIQRFSSIKVSIDKCYSYYYFKNTYYFSTYLDERRIIHIVFNITSKLRLPALPDEMPFFNGGFIYFLKKGRLFCIGNNFSSYQSKKVGKKISNSNGTSKMVSPIYTKIDKKYL